MQLPWAEDRSMLYRVAMTLGPRAAECGSLSPEDFIENEDGQTLIIDASQTKNGKEARIPVPQSLAQPSHFSPFPTILSSVFCDGVEAAGIVGRLRV